jgi:PAS domain S-box-containing protein
LSKIRAALLIANDRGRYLIVNAAAAKLTGYRRSELLQRSVWDLTPAIKQSVGRRLWRDFLVRGRMGGNYVLRQKNGRVVRARYAAIANVLPGIHVSLLVRQRPTRASSPRTRARQ